MEDGAEPLGEPGLLEKPGWSPEKRERNFFFVLAPVPGTLAPCPELWGSGWPNTPSCGSWSHPSLACPWIWCSLVGRLWCSCCPLARCCTALWGWISDSALTLLLFTFQTCSFSPAPRCRRRRSSRCCSGTGRSCVKLAAGGSGKWIDGGSLWRSRLPWWPPRSDGWLGRRWGGWPSPTPAGAGWSPLPGWTPRAKAVEQKTQHRVVTITVKIKALAPKDVHWADTHRHSGKLL